MIETIKAWTIVILFVVILALIGYIIYLLYRKKHTRERFAFFVGLTLSSIAISILTSLLSGVTLLGVFNNALNHFLGIKETGGNPSFSDHALALVLFSFFTHYLYKIYIDWDSNVISKRHHENNLRGINTSLVGDFFVHLKGIIIHDPSLEVYNKKDSISEDDILKGYEKIVQPWYESVSEILGLISNQYKIDLEKDWYRENDCIIASYGKEDERIYIYCLEDEPKKEQLQDYVEFAKKSKIKVKKIIIAIESLDLEKQEFLLEGIQVEKRYKGELLNGLVDFSAYNKFIKDSFEKEEISIGTEVSLSDMYVPSSGFHENQKKKIGNVEDYLTAWTEEKSDRHIALLGDYGQGKSVLALKFTYELIKNDSGRIPILIVLRGKSPRNLSPLEIIANWSSRFRIEPQAIMKLHYEGKLLLIFEGFDEMDLIGDSEMRMNHFRSLWNFVRVPNAKIMITGRPNFFLDDDEQRHALGIFKPKAISTPHSEAIYLENFNINKVGLALRNLSPKTREGIVNLARNNDNFFEIVSRPSILFLVSSIWNESNFNEKKEKINSASVINEFISANYERQAKKGHKSPITKSEREFFMMKIAYEMMRVNGYTNQIDINSLNRIILGILDNFPESVTNTSSALEGKIKSLNDRIASNEEVMRESVLTDVRSSGILVKDLSRDNYFKFSHKSFQEFLVSKAYLNSLINLQPQKGKLFLNLRNFLFSVPVNIIISEEIKSFIAELVANHIRINKSNSEITPRNILTFLRISQFPFLWISSVFAYYRQSFAKSIIVITTLFSIISMALHLVTSENVRNLEYCIKDFEAISSINNIIKEPLNLDFFDTNFPFVPFRENKFNLINSRLDSVISFNRVFRDKYISFDKFSIYEYAFVVFEILSHENDIYQATIDSTHSKNIILPMKIRIIDSLILEKNNLFSNLQKPYNLNVIKPYNELSNRRDLFYILTIISLITVTIMVLVFSRMLNNKSNTFNEKFKFEIWILTCEQLGYKKKDLRNLVYSKYLDQLEEKERSHLPSVANIKQDNV